MKFAIVLKYAATLIVGLAIYTAVLQPSLAVGMFTYSKALVRKATGGNEPCPWDKLFSYPGAAKRMADLEGASLGQLSVAGTDDALGIELVKTPGRSFWVKKAGSSKDGKELIAFVLAEQEWISREEPGHGVRKGDVVIDVGAHVGTFGDDALRRGAAKVIMVEPDPVNVECIRRNFKDELASGRVVLIPEGAWSKVDSLDFAIGVANSGTGSLVVDENGAKKIKVPVRPLDEMLKLAGIGKVDFIKMDIEGAEREALKGAAATLGQYKPRLMLDSYHLKDDDVVLPAVIHSLNASYQSFCAICSLSRWADDDRVVPYAVFY